jgi:hypothetical protein
VGLCGLLMIIIACEVVVDFHDISSIIII